MVSLIHDVGMALCALRGWEGESPECGGWQGQCSETALPPPPCLPSHLVTERLLGVQSEFNTRLVQEQSQEQVGRRWAWSSETGWMCGPPSGGPSRHQPLVCEAREAGSQGSARSRPLLCWG